MSIFSFSHNGLLPYKDKFFYMGHVYFTLCHKKSLCRGLTLYQRTNFKLSQILSLQMTILNLMKIAESSPKRVENTVGKGEIARY